jgi:ABC-type amino acid transport substrate-binding protein
MLICRLLLIFTLMLTWTPAMAAEPLRIGTEGAYPPFNSINENGKLVGFDVDIAMALCDAMGRKCVIQAIAWDDLIPALNNGKIDAIIASMAKTPDRERTIRFTNFYYRSRASFVGSPEIHQTPDEQDLKGKRIATQANTVQERYLKNSSHNIEMIITTKTIGEAFQLLATGQTDLVLSDSLINYDFLQTDAGKPFDFVGTPLPANDPSSEAHIAVRKNDKELANQFNSALKAIRLSGRYNVINRKYFPFSIY